MTEAERLILENQAAILMLLTALVSDARLFALAMERVEIVNQILANPNLRAA
jgi:hypothetical protein